MLKQQLQKTGEEFDKKFVGITGGTKRVWWVDEPDRVKQFIRQAQIDAVKAFAEEIENENFDLQDELEQKYNESLKNRIDDLSNEYAYCIAVLKQLQKNINNLLKDV